MEKTKDFAPPRFVALARLMVTGCFACAATAQQAPARMPAITELEQAFWACDYIATSVGVYAAPVEFCSTVTEELKRHKFGGDFGEWLAWWQRNKATEHAKVSIRASRFTGAPDFGGAWMRTTPHGVV